MGQPERPPLPGYLESAYDPPNAISLDKVITRFDHHTKSFIEAATFLAASVRDGWGDPVPVIAGGPRGFARVIDPVTVEIEIAPGSWPETTLSLAPPQRYATGALLVIPGVKETVRMKGTAFVSRLSGDPDAALRMILRIDNSYFHCAKAFIRSRIWDTPPTQARWTGLRAFRCVRKEPESADISSFYFEPADGGAAPEFRPGQHVPVQITHSDGGEPLRRAYSLSSRPGERTIRITVKREPPSGLASGYMHDHVEVGSAVEMRNPAGRFVLDESSRRPVVLLSAGVGLTPLVSMLDHLVAIGSGRQIWFFHGARSGREHAMRDHLRTVARDHDNVHLHVCYGRPRPEDRRGIDFETEGRLTVDVLRSHLPPDDHDFYLCGPALFMREMAAGLSATGIRPERIRWEAFSPEAFDLLDPAVMSGERPAPARPRSAGTETAVEFRRSGRTVSWTGECASLLDLAEFHGVPVRSGCRTGECFTCAVRLVSGEVGYARELEDAPEAGTILLCSAVPEGAVVIDL